MKLFLKDTERSSMTQGKKTPDIAILSCKEHNKHTVMSWPTKGCCAFPWSQDRRCNHKIRITPVCFGGSQEKVLQLKGLLKTWSWLQLIAQYMTNCKRLWRPPRGLKEKNIKAFPRDSSYVMSRSSQGSEEVITSLYSKRRMCSC